MDFAEWLLGSVLTLFGIVDAGNYEVWAAGAAITSALVALATLLFIVVQLRQLTRQTRYQQQVDRSEMFLHLSELWTKALPHRIKVMSSLPRRTFEELCEERGSDYKTFMATKDWADLRVVLNFYETVGLMIHQGYLSADEAFVLVSVDYYPVDHAPSFDEGGFYSLVHPYLRWIRKHYRQDIYVFYDKYLAQKYFESRPRPFMPRNPEQPDDWLRRIGWNLSRAGSYEWDGESDVHYVRAPLVTRIWKAMSLSRRV